MLHVLASRTPVRRAPALLLAALALVVFAAGCGSDSNGGGRLLSRQQAGDLRGQLEIVRQDIAAKNCTGAEQQVTALRDQIDSIRRLNRNLRSALRASTRRLETLVNDNCQAATTTTPTTTETTPTTPEHGSTGATGTSGEQGSKQKKPKKEKPPKTTPPGQGGKEPPGQQGGGGGAGVPGESGQGGSGD